MLFDHRSTEFHHFRDQLSVITLPINYVVSAPIKAIHSITSDVVSKRDLLAENAQLKAHELLLQSKLQKLLTLERENAQLKELLSSTSEVPGKVLVAQLLATSLDPSLHQIIVDKGSHNHIYVGQPVLDAYGVLGQVVDVGPFTSKVLLVIDQHSAVPVEDTRSGVRAIAMGSGESDELNVINLPTTSDVKAGDMFIASGLGLRFPVGYPVGVVSGVSNKLGSRFAVINLAPSAHINRSQQVLLAWPSKASFYKAAHEQLQKKLPNSTPRTP